MTAETNRLAKSKGKEKSPTDPQECCDWANERMNPELAAYGVRWVVTGNKDQPIALSDRCVPRLLAPGSKPSGRDRETGLDAKHESRISAQTS